ncbi:DUF5677 domain-containing protein [Shewanella algae]
MFKTEDIRAEVDRSKLILNKLNQSNLDENKILALKFWEKFIQNNECMSKLIDTSYIDEANTIYRLSLEHLFNMFALVRKPGFVEQLRNSSEVNIPKALKEISKNEEQAEQKVLTPENARLLKEAMEKHKEQPVKDLGYSIYNAAQASELKCFYDSAYRLKSLSHAHSTFLSILIENNESDVNNLIESAMRFLKIAATLIEREF